MNDLLSFSQHLADEAGAIIRQYFRTAFDIETKQDDSPVTIADRAVEKRLRDILETERPQDGIIGEEFGIKKSQSGLNWVIDPIDGTKSFMIGRPTFGTLIALWEGDETPMLGIIDQPILQERWTGYQNETRFNGQIVRTRACSSIEQATICSTSPAMFSQTGPVYEALNAENKMAWGGDCYMYGLIASGHLDMAIEASLSTYDFAALVPVIQGAGGIITDFKGQPMTLQSDGSVLTCGDKALHEKALLLVQSCS